VGEGDVFRRSAFFFNYDDREWQGTMARTFAQCRGEEVEFVDICLPCDGSVFANTDVGDDVRDASRGRQDACEWIADVAAAFKACPQFTREGFSCISSEIQWRR
jgi:hypothetical protein